MYGKYITMSEIDLYSCQYGRIYIPKGTAINIVGDYGYTNKLYIPYTILVLVKEQLKRIKE